MTDFIKLPAWPAFNVADMAITFGVLSLLWVLESNQGERRSDRDAVSAVAGERVEITVAAESAGTRLDRFLAGPLGSRAQAQSLIDAERVRVDGRTRPKRHVVKAGERIEVQLPVPDPSESEREPAPFTVAYEDEYLLVVDKPAGVVVHPARGHRTGTLAQALDGRAAGGRGAVAGRDRPPPRP